MNLVFRKLAVRLWFTIFVTGSSVFLACALPAVAFDTPHLLRISDSNRHAAPMTSVTSVDRRVLNTGIIRAVSYYQPAADRNAFLIRFPPDQLAERTLLPNSRHTASIRQTGFWNQASEWQSAIFLRPREWEPPLFAVSFVSDAGYASAVGGPQLAQRQDDLFSTAESQRFVQDVTGDFAVRLFVRAAELPEAGPGAAGQVPHRFVREGVLVWQDDWNFLRYERVASTGEDGNAVYLWGMYFSDGSELAAVDLDLPDENVVLRVERNYRVCTLQMSPDGQQWTNAGPTHWRSGSEWSTVRPIGARITFDDAVKVGVYAINGTDRWSVLQFRDFQLEQGTPGKKDTPFPAGRPARKRFRLAVQTPISLWNTSQETESRSIRTAAGDHASLTGRFEADQKNAAQHSESVPDFATVPRFRKINEHSVYGDVLSHSKRRPFGDALGRATNVHETTHGINAFLRRKYAWRAASGRINGFYVLDGRGVILLEPNLKKSAVAGFVPDVLRFDGYGIYMDDEAWEDFPLYLLDEWVAYVNDSMANVDDVRSGRYAGGWTNGVTGCLEFSIYAVALAMAVAEHDPAYWQNYTQFRTFLVWHLKRAQRAYLAGHRLKQFAWDRQDQLLNDFLTAPEAGPMREFIRSSLGGVWLDTPQLLPEQ